MYKLVTVICAKKNTKKPKYLYVQPFYYCQSYVSYFAALEIVRDKLARSGYVMHEVYTSTDVGLDHVIDDDEASMLQIIESGVTLMSMEKYLSSAESGENVLH